MNTEQESQTSITELPFNEWGWYVENGVIFNKKMPHLAVAMISTKTGSQITLPQNIANECADILNDVKRPIKGVYLTLKWGTLKSWDFTNSFKCLTLLEEYCSIGNSASAMLQYDTPRQKEIICELIDYCEGDTIYLEWDGVDVSKQEAKEYVMTYGEKKENRDEKQSG